MELVNVNNVTYACKIHQRDETLPRLLMLHGFMGDHRVFDHLINELCESCNPVTIDLLGHGQSSKPTTPSRYNESKQVDDILKVIHQLDLSSPFLFGYSMGGRLALKTALAASNTFQGLILESTTCGITDLVKRTERQKIDAERAESIRKNFTQFLSQWKELDLFKSPVSVDESLAEKYHQIQAEQSPDALPASLRGFGTGTMTPTCNELKQLDLPVLLLAGSLDEKYQQINSDLAEQFPNATFSSIKAGHRTHLDNPLAFLSELKNFIRIHS